jgi:hypothetical protein
MDLKVWVGQTFFGKKIVSMHNRKDGIIKYECECGGSGKATIRFILSGKAKCLACGKRHIDPNDRLNSPEYHAWKNLLYNYKNHDVCEKWSGKKRLQGFESFYEDVGPRPAHYYYLSVLDPDRKIDASNVQWASKRRRAQK